MNYLILGLILSFCSTQIFAQNINPSYFSLGVYNSSFIPYSQYFHSKRTVSDAQKLFRKMLKNYSEKSAKIFLKLALCLLLN